MQQDLLPSLSKGLLPHFFQTVQIFIIGNEASHSVLFTPTSCRGSAAVGVAVQQARAVARTKRVGHRCAHMLRPHREALMFANDCFPLTPTHR